MKETANEAALCFNRDIAGPATEVGAVLGMDGFEAIRDSFNSCRPSLFGLR